MKNIEYLCSLFEKYEGLLTQTQKQAFRLYFYENLSFDLCWKNENTLVVIERWSTAVAYNNFLKLEETKSINKELEKFIYIKSFNFCIIVYEFF
ncbi:hypothetical protein [Mycoplasmopsis bovis]|uniref:hypothetical protein n=1 Tax=Mycoplasmopsis bovis TaxID=28903 RepID=UPI003D2CDCA5